MKVITKTDNWNPTLYDSKHRFVSDYGKDIIEISAPL